MTRSNSTIVRKKCKCGKCNRYPSFGCNGFNYNCLTDEEKQVIGTKNKVAQKKKAYNNAQKRQLHIAQNNLQEDAVKLVLWFKYQMQVSKKVCENCGVSLAHYSDKEWYNSQHHIIEKSLCPSVALHPQNHIVLGYWCCHSHVHTNWLNVSKMACYEEMRKKFNMFKEYISENELSKLHKHPFLL